MADDRLGQQQRVPGDAGSGREALGIPRIRRLQDVGQLPQRLRRRTEPVPGQQRAPRERSRVRATRSGSSSRSTRTRPAARATSAASSGTPPGRTSIGVRLVVRLRAVAVRDQDGRARRLLSVRRARRPLRRHRAGVLGAQLRRQHALRRGEHGPDRVVGVPDRPGRLRRRCPTASCSSTTGSRPAGSRSRRSTDPIRPSTGVATTPTTTSHPTTLWYQSEAIGPKHLWWLGYAKAMADFGGPSARMVNLNAFYYKPVRNAGAVQSAAYKYETQGAIAQFSKETMDRRRQLQHRGAERRAMEQGLRPDRLHVLLLGGRRPARQARLHAHA